MVKRSVAAIFLATSDGFVNYIIALDEDGFIKTGADLSQGEFKAWSDRQPYVFEMSRPGMFAAGDVRLGSAKRVAAAVGEGSACVQFIHRVIAEERDGITLPSGASAAPD